MCPPKSVIPLRPSTAQTFSPMAGRHFHPTSGSAPETQGTTPAYREAPVMPDQRGVMFDWRTPSDPAGPAPDRLGVHFAQVHPDDPAAHAFNPLAYNTRLDVPQYPHNPGPSPAKPYYYAPQSGIPETSPYSQFHGRERPIHQLPITPPDTEKSSHPSPEPLRLASPVLEATRSQNCEPSQAHDEWARRANNKRVYDPWEIIGRGKELQLHPLLTPASSGSEVYLQWDMRWHTGQCQRSCDRGTESWYHGRSHPATCPRVTCLRITCGLLPYKWPLRVYAQDPNSGVTCGDVVEAIRAFLDQRISQAEYDEANDAQETLRRAFWNNRSVAHDAPGGMLRHTLLRLDCLGETTKFGGLVAANAHNDGSPRGTFELVCLKRYPEKRGEYDRHARPKAGQSHSDSDDSLYLDAQPPPGTQPDEHTRMRYEAAAHPAAAATTYQHEPRSHASARRHDRDHTAPAREHRPVVNQTTRPDASYPSYPPPQGASHPPLGGTSYPAAQGAPYAPPPPGQYTPHGGVHFADGGQAARPPHIQPDIEPETRRARGQSQRPSTALPTAHADIPELSNHGDRASRRRATDGGSRRTGNGGHHRDRDDA